MALVLGLDTSMSACSVALSEGMTVIARESDTMTRGQSEALAPMIDRIMTASGRNFDQLDAIAVTRGPGAFTGLRIGLAAARSLALTTDCPCLGVSTFDVLGRQALTGASVEMPANAVLVIVIETKRDDFYIQAVNPDGSHVIAPSAQMARDIRSALPADRPLFVVGDGRARLCAELGPDGPEMDHIEGIDVPDPAVLVDCARAFLDTPEDAPASPLYLRPPDVTMPK